LSLSDPGISSAPTDMSTITYDAEILPDEHWWVVGRARSLEAILARLVPSEGPSLDVGAGTGSWAARLARSYPPMVAVEPDPSLRKRIVARGFAGQSVAASLPGPLPFASDQFRLVTCLDVLEHIDEDHASARELARVVAPGGWLLLTVPAHPRLWSSMDNEVGHRRRYTLASFGDVVTQAGFTPVVISPLNVWLYPAAAVLRRRGIRGARMPGALANRALAALFGSEGVIAGRWPSFARGLSWVALARKKP
jgi:SAM-dependent methyltransferase